jgi:YbbR domain-containing protein
VSRILGAIVYNWPLKLAALALATLLYVGLIFSENTQSRDVSIQINPVPGSQPRDTILIGELGFVTNLRYFVADQTNVAITPANFTATVDLAGLEPSTAPQSVRVQVTSADPRIQVQTVTPAFVSVHLETLERSDVPVDVVPGPVPSGLAIDDPKASLEKVTAIGAASDITKVVAAQATVSIDASGIDVNRDIPLIPVDELGARVNGVDLEPPTVHVTMGVFPNQDTATVPITPAIVGSLAPGFDLGRVTVSSPSVAVKGAAEDLANVSDLQTQPISLDGRTADFDATVGFVTPQGITVLRPESVTVHVQIRAVSVSRSFTAGIVLQGARPDRQYALSVPQAIVTIGGAPADLDALNGATLSLTANVADLDPGSHAVTLSIQLRSGLTVVAISPPAVTVVVSQAAPPSSGSSGAPSASGGG